MRFSSRLITIGTFLILLVSVSNCGKNNYPDNTHYPRYKPTRPAISDLDI